MILNRTGFTVDGIFGTLSDDAGNRVAYTLEHSYNCVPKLPDGTYTCVKGHHMLHSGPIEAFEITGVPGHTGVLLHYGNYNADSDGCVLLGDGSTATMITGSRDAFDKLMVTFTGVDSFTLTVTSSPK
jgi:uncharacterized protein DUF5675